MILFVHPDLNNTLGFISIKNPYRIDGFLINYTTIILADSLKHKGPYPNLTSVVFLNRYEHKEVDSISLFSEKPVTFISAKKLMII